LKRLNRSVSNLIAYNNKPNQIYSQQYKITNAQHPIKKIITKKQKIRPKTRRKTSDLDTDLEMTEDKGISISK
jgi:hypothetical protein